MAKLFLEQMLTALNDNAFPLLEEIRFEGFTLLKRANSRESADAELAGIFQMVEESRFADGIFHSHLERTGSEGPSWTRSHHRRFIFGGAVNPAFDLASPDDKGYKDVYVLSLPAFRWFKANATVDVRRASHTCSVIGKRQMILIGGRLPSSRRALGREPDSWSSSIGIFDMTLLHWQDHYDADAENWGDATLASILKYTGERVSKGDVPNKPEVPVEGSTVVQDLSLPVSVIVGGVRREQADQGDIFQVYGSNTMDLDALGGE
ncbi:hypothetical protein MBLNU13_g02336t1 [Cladosporium sp. NU13]